MFSRLNLSFVCKILAKVVRVCIGKLNYGTSKCLKNVFKIIIFEMYLWSNGRLWLTQISLALYPNKRMKAKGLNVSFSSESRNCQAVMVIQIQ